PPRNARPAPRPGARPPPRTRPARTPLRARPASPHRPAPPAADRAQRGAERAGDPARAAAALAVRHRGGAAPGGGGLRRDALPDARADLFGDGAGGRGFATGRIARDAGEPGGF